MTSLQERIAAELNRVLDHQEQGGFTAPGALRGMAVTGPGGAAIVLNVDDVAAIVARVVATPAQEDRPRLSSDELRAQMADQGFVSTPESQAWAKRALAESKERRAKVDRVGILRDLRERYQNQGQQNPAATNPENNPM